MFVYDFEIISYVRPKVHYYIFLPLVRLSGEVDEAVESEPTVSIIKQLLLCLLILSFYRDREISISFTSPFY